MEVLSSGEFFGDTNQRLEVDGLVFTNTVYTHDYVDWHHHENAYLTFIWLGKVIEGNKSGKLNLSAGSLVYHHVQEAHYNIKPRGQTCGMHLEFSAKWIDTMSLCASSAEGSFEIFSPKAKILCYKMLTESQQADAFFRLAIQQLSIELFVAATVNKKDSKFCPPWVSQVQEILHDQTKDVPDFQDIARVVGVHPIHLSRAFSKYFGCTMATYMRQIRVAKAFALLQGSKQSLGQIAYQAGFSDQSHMIRCFKEFGDLTPAYFRRQLKFERC